MPSRIVRIPAALRREIRSASELWRFGNMFIWNMMIRFLRPWMPLRRLVPIISPAVSTGNISRREVTRNMRWLDAGSLFGSDGTCIVRSLMYFRFMNLAGVPTNLVIGLNEMGGHAWVEANGSVLFDACDINERFSPILLVKHGESRLEPVGS